MNAPRKVSVIWRSIRITVDEDILAAHPRAKGAEVDLATAIELMEMQWKKDHATRAD